MLSLYQGWEETAMEVIYVNQSSVVNEKYWHVAKKKKKVLQRCLSQSQEKYWGTFIRDTKTPSKTDASPRNVPLEVNTPHSKMIQF